MKVLYETRARREVDLNTKRHFREKLYAQVHVELNLVSRVVRYPLPYHAADVTNEVKHGVRPVTIAQ